MAYIITKLSVYSIQDNTHKIPMDCSKLYVMHDILLSLSTGRSECQQYNHKVNHCLCINRHSISILELSHILFVVGFTLVGQLAPGSDLLVCCSSQWMAVADNYCLSDTQ